MRSTFQFCGSFDPRGHQSIMIIPVFRKRTPENGGNNSYRWKWPAGSALSLIFNRSYSSQGPPINRIGDSSISWFHEEDTFTRFCVILSLKTIHNSYKLMMKLSNIKMAKKNINKNCLILFNKSLDFTISPKWFISMVYETSPLWNLALWRAILCLFSK